MQIEDLYDKYELPLLRYAKSMTSDKELAEDLVQDTFLRAMGNIQTLNGLPESDTGLALQSAQKLFY